MLHFDCLKKLFVHAEHMQTVLPQGEHFFVGGCVRDLLLDVVDEPTDLDLTMIGEPEKIRDQMTIDEQQFSRFRTEKFGTMSIIVKNPSFDKENEELRSEVGDVVSYEITPFRAESGHADHRHPDEIVRSNDLLEDSARRDFTINCLYRTP